MPEDRSNPWPFPRGVYGPPLRCKHCGSAGVYWQRTREGYQLFNEADLQKHVCKPNAEGFSDV